MQQKIVRIGNSIGVIIPKDIAKKSGIKAGSKVYVDKDPNGSSIIINKDATALSSSITPDFLKIVNNVHKKYGPALRRLAQPNHDR